MNPERAKRRSFARWLASLVGFVALLIVLLTATSRFLEQGAAGTALALNPSNSEARLRAVIDELAQDAPDNASLQEFVRQGIVLAPGDARLYSLQGILAEKANKDDDANRLFERALVLSKAEQFAGAQMLVRKARLGQFDEAISIADVFLRRWPGKLDDIAPALKSIIEMPGGYSFMIAQLGGDAPWRGRFLANLGRNPKDLALLYRTLVDLRTSPRPPSSVEVAPAITEFFQAGLVDQAYKLFLQTLSDEERKRAGLVFNGDFNHATNKTPFDWRFSSLKGVEVSMPDEAGGARFQFQGRPVTQIDFSQVLALLPGAYRLNAVVSGVEFAAPRGVFLALACEQRNVSLSRLAMPTGTFSDTALVADFEIPAEGCDTQRIAVQSGLTAESWTMRYAGVLKFKLVEIQEPNTQ